MPHEGMDKYESLKLENQLCFPLYAAARKVMRNYRPYLEPLGLTYTQYVAMLALWAEPCLSVKALGERLYLDSGTLTPVLKSLEAKGLILRRRSPADERVLLAELTADGAALRDRALTVPRDVGACLPLSAEETGTLYALLYKLLGED